MYYDYKLIHFIFIINSSIFIFCFGFNFKHFSRYLNNFLIANLLKKYYIHYWFVIHNFICAVKIYFTFHFKIIFRLS